MGFISVIALLLSWLKIPFELKSYLLTMGTILLISAFFSKGFRSVTTEDSAKISYLLAPLWPWMIMTVFLTASFSTFTVPPHFHDGSFHGLLTERIFETKSVLPDITNGSLYTPPLNGKMYPFAIHAAASLIMQWTGLPAYKSVFYLVLLLVSMFPLIFYNVVYLISNNDRISLVAAWFSLPLLIFRPFGWGGYTQWAGLVLLLLAVGVFIKAYQTRDQAWVLITAILLVSVFYAHMAEILTFVLLLLPFLWVRFSEETTHDKLKTIRFLAGIALIFFILLIPALPYLSNQTHSIGGYATFAPEEQGVLRTILIFGWETFGKHHAFIWMFYFVIGFFSILSKRKYRWLAVSQVFFVALYFWLSLDPKGILKYIAFPYYNDASRLLYVQPLFIVSFSAFGFLLVLDWLRNRKRSLILKLMWGVTILNLGWSLLRIEKELQSYKALSVFGTEALQAIRWINENISRSDVFLNDTADGSYWIPSMIGNPTLLNKSQEKSLDYSDRIYLLDHADKAGVDPRIDILLQKYNISYLFYNETTLPNGTRHLNRDRIRSNFKWDEVYTSEQISIFDMRR